MEKSGQSYILIPKHAIIMAINLRTKQLYPPPHQIASISKITQKNGLFAIIVIMIIV